MGALQIDTRSLDYYRKMVKQHPASILLRARGEVLEEKNIKKSRGGDVRLFSEQAYRGIRPHAGTWLSTFRERCCAITLKCRSR